MTSFHFNPNDADDENERDGVNERDRVNERDGVNELDDVKNFNAENGQMVEDSILEVLLSEAFGEPSRPSASRPPGPPDQTQVILQRWHQTRNEPSPLRVAKASSTSSKTNSSFNWMAAFAIVAGILIVAGLSWGVQNRMKVDGLANQASSPEPESLGPAESAESPASEKRDEPEADGFTPSRVIELAGPPTEPSDSPAVANQSGDRSANAAARAGVRPIEPIQLVSRSIDQHLKTYWQRADVNATALMSNERTAARLKDRFGIQIAPQSVGDPESVLVELQRPENLNALANRFVETMSGRPLAATNAEADAPWMGQLRRTWKQRSGMDRLIASWFKTNDAKQPDAERANDKSKKTPQLRWLFGSAQSHELLVSAAALTHNADLRCQRCHDMPARGNETNRQVAYWSFAATLLPSMQANESEDQRVFYDTVDGRRKLAEIRPELKPTAENLIGSPKLAGGLVDWVWRTIHGRPLVTNPYDLSGTTDEEMRGLHQELADDLVASDFDLLRTVALVMTESILGRDVPDAMTPEGILAADDTKWTDAVAAIDSFAASAPATKSTSSKQRMQLVAEAGIPKVQQLGGINAVLAQPLGREDIDGTDGSGGKRSRDNALKPAQTAALAGLPMRSTWVMPGWLDRLESVQSRENHLAHLAGRLELPETVEELADQMRVAGVDEALILQRIWWIIGRQG